METLTTFCKANITKIIVVLACIFTININAQISTFPYFQDFETTNGGWAAGGTFSDWVWGTPSKPTITAAGGGAKCWINGGLTLSGVGYNNNEVSYVTSPVFNFSSLSYPWISFKLFWETERKWDGGNLQYSLNGGTTWIRVGNLGDPIDCMNANWYNTNNISKLVTLDPATTGWGGNHYAFGTVPSGTATCFLGSGSNGWVVAKHCLTGLAGQPNVKFRFTFGAGFVCNYYDGLAFDDILISDGMANAPNFSTACGAAAGQINLTSILPSCPNPTTTTLAWNFGDPASGAANTSATSNPSHTYTTPGIYTISLTQTGGPCNPPGVITHTILIMNSAITASTNVTCFGGNNGSAAVTPTNGTAPYTYAWLPTGGTGATGTALTAGIFSVTVTDAVGCKKTSTVTITQPPVLNLSINSNNTTCGSAVGSATVTATGGTPNYTYSWTSGAGTSSVATALAAGAYSVTVTDSHACANFITTTISSSGGPTITLTSTNVACFGGATGIATANAVGGISPYTYSWSPTGGTAITASGLVAGNYNIIATDASGCVGSAAIVITQPLAPVTAVVSSTNITCNGLANGLASVNASGGTAGYTYNWLPSGGTGSSANTLSTNVYSVTVTDTKNCTATSTVNITQPSMLTASVMVTNITCNGANNGSSTVIASGSNGGYTYNWLPSGGNSTSAINLSTGNYSAVVTDSKGCTKITAFIIGQPTAITTNAISNNVMCNGQTTGSVSVTASGGAGGFTYNWQPSASTNSNVTGLGAGVYTVIVTDANGCTKTTFATISQPAILNVSPLNNQNICKGQSAVLSANINGGTPAYTINWQPINSYGTNVTVTPTITTTYSVIATDNNGCASLPAIITVSVAASVSLTVNSNVNVCNSALTTLTASAFGGSGNYQYNWTPSNANTSSITFTASNNQLYSVSVNDGCSSVIKTISVTVTPKPAIKPFNTVTGCTPLCVNFSDSVLIKTGVIMNWEWNFSNGTISNSNSPIICFTSAGTYSGVLNVITTNGCAYKLADITGITALTKPQADFTSNIGFESTEYNSTFLFTNASTNYSTVTWYLSNNTPVYGNNVTATFGDIGLYPVMLVASNSMGCADTAIKIIKINSEFTFYAPNCFTPNDDNLNNTFLPKGMGWDSNTFKMQIFDRWGAQIFSTNNPFEGWDGTFKGRGGDKVQDDTYIWKVYLKDIYHKEHSYVGHVSIIK